MTTTPSCIKQAQTTLGNSLSTAGTGRKKGDDKEDGGLEMQTRLEPRYVFLKIFTFY